MKNKSVLSFACVLSAVLLLGISAYAEDGSANENGERVAVCAESSQEAMERLYSSPRPVSAVLSSDDYSAAEDALYNGLIAGQEQIDLSEYNIPFDDFSSFYDNFLESHYEIFFIGEYSYYGRSSYITSFKPTYTIDASQIASAVKEYKRIVEGIVSQVDSSWYNVDKALYLHDYLDSHFCYDTTYTNYYSYEFLTQGTGVCNAYALTYALLLGQVGVPAIKVTSSSMNHAWNMVYIGGKWYHADVTWDDPLDDEPSAVRQHIYFLLSDTAITAKKHSGWDSTITCTDTTYDHAFWNSVEEASAIIPFNGNYYYMLRGKMYVCDSDGKQISSTYVTANNGGFPNLALFNGKIYLNYKCDIICFDPVSKSTSLLYQTKSRQNIESFTMYGNIAACTLADGSKLNIALDRKVTSLKLTGTPSVTRYAPGDTLVTDGLAAEATWSDGETDTIDISALKLSCDLSTVGDKTVTIGYSGCSASYTVKVEAPLLSGTLANVGGVEIFKDGTVTIKPSSSSGDGSIVLASYGADGRIASVVIVPASSLSGGAVTRLLPGSDASGAHVKAFSLSSGYLPSGADLAA